MNLYWGVGVGWVWVILIQGLGPADRELVPGPVRPGIGTVQVCDPRIFGHRYLLYGPPRYP